MLDLLRQSRCSTLIHRMGKHLHRLKVKATMKSRESEGVSNWVCETAKRRLSWSCLVVRRKTYLVVIAACPGTSPSCADRPVGMDTWLR